MKYSAIFLIFVSFNVFSETVDKACLKQAISLVKQLNTEVFTNMDSKQRDKTLKIASDTCKEHFGTSEKKNSIAAKDNKQEEAENANDEDSFTQKILTGAVPDKEGNKRLKRLRHK